MASAWVPRRLAAEAPPASSGREWEEWAEQLLIWMAVQQVAELLNFEQDTLNQLVQIMKASSNSEVQDSLNKLFSTRSAGAGEEGNNALSIYS